ncbi:MAG TPA: hypothetical protein VEQ63_03850, partial [Bryobacteraceae bacterium]|nr:hypothetical protein [Bryobacteraceae bacterium]
LGQNGAAGASGSYSPQATLVLVRARREAWVRGHVQVSDDAVSAAISFRSLLASYPRAAGSGRRSLHGAT